MVMDKCCETCKKVKVKPEEGNTCIILFSISYPAPKYTHISKCASSLLLGLFISLPVCKMQYYTSGLSYKVGSNCSNDGQDTDLDCKSRFFFCFYSALSAGKKCS